MKMFTRRIRHRNTLLEHGIDSSNTVPPVQATGGASGGETATGMTEVNPDANNKDSSISGNSQGNSGHSMSSGLAKTAAARAAAALKKERMHERSESHQTIEVGGQIIGKPGGRGKPQGGGQHRVVIQAAVLYHCRVSSPRRTHKSRSRQLAKAMTSPMVRVEIRVKKKARPTRRLAYPCTVPCIMAAASALG